jgi:hypothetical protein
MTSDSLRFATALDELAEFLANAISWFAMLFGSLVPELVACLRFGAVVAIVGDVRCCLRGGAFVRADPDALFYFSDVK